MAVFLDEIIGDGILLSHELSKKYYSNIYIKDDPKVLLYSKIYPEHLSDAILQELKKMGSRITKIDIKKPIDTLGDDVYGFVKFTGNVAYIVVNGKKNECWQRFTICKELLQIYIDNTTDATPYSNSEIVQQITELVSSQTDAFNSFNSDIDLSSLSYQQDDRSISELTSIFAVMDLIFPYPEKSTDVETILDNIKQDVIDYYDAALRYKMPEFMIAGYYSQMHTKSKVLASKNIPTIHPEDMEQEKENKLL